MKDFKNEDQRSLEIEKDQKSEKLHTNLRPLKSLLKPKGDLMDAINKPKNIISETIFIMIISFSHGLMHISSLGMFFYQKEVLKLEPQTIQLLNGIVSFPWCIKPVFGYFSDKIISKYGKCKYIIYITSTTRLILFAFITYHRAGAFVFYVVCFLTSFCTMIENINAEYLLVIKTKQENERYEKEAEMENLRGNFKTKKVAKRANKLPIYFGFRATGSLIGTFSSGRIISKFSNEGVFFICSIIPLFIILLSFLYEEESKKGHNEKKNFKEELKTIKKLIFRDKVFQLIVFIFLINLTPDFTMLITFYLTDHLKFSKNDISNFNSFSTLCYIIGLILYSYFFKNVDPKKFYLTTNFLYWLSNLSFLLVVFDLLTKINVSNYIFCLLSQGLSSFIGELNFMPILAIWCTLCPKNLEATSITLFTGFINLSNNMSNYFGAFLIYILKIHKTDYNKLWIPIIIQNTYLLILIVGILFISFPNVEKQNAENDEEKEQNEENEKFKKNEGQVLKNDKSVLID